MSIATWVLVLTLTGGREISIATVPGYPTEQACQAAGEKWADVRWKGYRCIPGPAALADPPA